MLLERSNNLKNPTDIDKVTKIKQFSIDVEDDKGKTHTIQLDNFINAISCELLVKPQLHRINDTCRDYKIGLSLECDGYNIEIKDT